MPFSFELSGSKYDKDNPSELYEKATKQLKNEKYKAALSTLKKYTKAEKDDADGSVSYTHLTLPTIYSV